MTYNITRFSPFSPIRVPFWDDDSDFGMHTTNPNGLSISEDDANVYITAAVPGVDPKDIEVTFDKGVLWIKGEAKTEEKEGTKVYQSAVSSFSYRVLVPGELDQNQEPKATTKHGMMTVAFAKLPKSEPKKISVEAK